MSNINDFIIEDGVLVKYTGNDAVIVIPECVTDIGEWAFAACLSIVSVELHDEVYRIQAGAFFSCDSLKRVIIPKYVSYIGEGAFEGSTSLTIYCERELESPEWNANWNASGAPVVWNHIIERDEEDDYYDIEIEEELEEYALSDKYNKNDFSIDNGTLSDYYGDESVVIIPNGVNCIDRRVFGGHDEIESVKMPNSVTSIGKGAFEECTSLKSIVLSNKLTIIGESAFASCESLNNVILPNSVKNIGSCAFSMCESLEEIMVPASVTDIEDGTFSGCDSLKKIVIPYGVSRIGDNAFSFCVALENITIPKGVTNIGCEAFISCESLTQIIIPESVTNIEGFAFCNCPSLTICCEVDSQPDGWDEDWNCDNNPVVWGYKK